MRHLLLISNSVQYGKGYLDHCADIIVDFLGSINEILFIPFAVNDYDRYEKTVQERFLKMDKKLKSIHHYRNYIKAVKESKAIFIGGGNTFRLLNALYSHELVNFICSQVIKHGVYYIGASAGANVACPTIKTTNDMPIVYPPSFDALNLVPFQINPHYVDSDENSKHKGETREQRIKEFHEENDVPVVGLREGSWLEIINNRIQLGGKNGAKIFAKNKKSKEYITGTILNLGLGITLYHKKSLDRKFTSTKIKS